MKILGYKSRCQIQIQFPRIVAHQRVGPEPVGEHHPLPVRVELVVVLLQVVGLVADSYSSFVAALLPPETDCEV